VVLLGEERKDAFPARDAARAVQEDERRAVPRLEDLDRGPTGAEWNDAGARRRAHAAAGRSAVRWAAAL
jgi:hypothetical protein